MYIHGFRQIDVNGKVLTHKELKRWKEKSCQALKKETCCSGVTLLYRSAKDLLSRIGIAEVGDALRAC